LINMRASGYVATLAALVFPAAATAGWWPEKVLTQPDDGLVSTPQVSFDRAGRALLAYERSAGDAALVEARIWDAANGFGEPTKISGPEPGPDDVREDVAVVANRRGDAVISWGHLFTRQFWTVVKRPGRPFGPPQLLKSNWADIALAEDGSGLMAYQEGSAIEVRRLDRRRRRFGLPVTLAKRSNGAPDAAIASNGLEIVAWVDRSRSGNSISVATRRQGARRFRVRRLASGAVSRPAEPQVVAGGRRSAMVAWATRKSHEALWVSLRRPGAGFGHPQRVFKGRIQTAVPVLDATARATVAARIGPAEDTRIEVAQAAPGRRFGPVSVVSDRGRRTTNPLVRVGPRGDAAVAWTGAMDGRRLAQVATRAPGGRLRGPERLPGPGAAHEVLGLDIDERGTVIAGWAGSDGGRFIAAGTWPAGSAPSGRVVGRAAACWRPEFEAAQDGFAVMAWLSDCGAYTSGVVYATVRRPGAEFETAQPISTQMELSGAFPGLGVGEGGHAIVTWEVLDRPDRELLAAEHLP
jgi:hypothetical protein